MYRKLLSIGVLAWLANPAVQADPIHVIADGAYWHHESHWVFPERIGAFVRVGIPQDVAGSQDAVAHYAYVENGVRNTASVDVYRVDSAAAAEHETRPAARATMQGELPLGPARAFSASRQIYARDDAEAPAFAGVYFIVAGEWRVTIRVSGSKLEVMDAFVRDQRWETLNDH